MDRITYISRFSDNLTSRDIDDIGRKSVVNNARDGLTGALMCLNGVFYQILEGDREQLYRCFNRIQTDPRHIDIFILDIQKKVENRQYPEWSMKTVQLDENTDPLMTPIRNLLTALTTTHTTLKKYAPSEVLNGIQKGQHPLEWGMERNDMIVLFCDLIGFSTLMENAAMDEVQQVLNRYYKLALSAISDAGGTISKLLGDGFLAYFSISHAQQALQASINIMKALKHERETSTSPYQQLCYCAIGVSAGPVIIGNIGSMVKMDYTVLGDVVNSAARLEGYTREVGHSVLFDHRFKDLLPSVMESEILNVGTLTPKGKIKGLEVYTLDTPLTVLDKKPEEIAAALRSVN